MNQELYRYYVTDRAHRKGRIRWEADPAAPYAAAALSPEERMVDRFCRLCALETPAFEDFEVIVLRRTVENLPDCFTPEEWAQVRKTHYVHELGYVSNLSPNYGRTIAEGLLARYGEATEGQRRMMDALIDLCDRYRAEASRRGRADLVEVLGQVPRYGARNLREALQFFRILHFALWLEGDYHNTVGRFDLYMAPYFHADMDAGVYTREEALALLEDFFISFNKDSDLYVGVQQGDNGQSLVLGGVDAQGNEVYSLLSELCLEASRNLKLIDPKINLRVSDKTPLAVFEKATELTAAGLGFPQYSNDGVVIPALEALGYAPEDAANYAVAACWEYVIPAVGDDIANIGALDLPALVDRALRGYLAPRGEDDTEGTPDRAVDPLGGKTFGGLMEAVRGEIRAACDRITERIGEVWFAPSPFMDLLRDGRKYRNFGLHGCGIATAADSLAAVRRYVFEEGTATPSRLFAALDTDFADDPELLHRLRFEAPKMGQDDDGVDLLAGELLHAFADALADKRNAYGGIWRAGTGTAMYYLWYGQKLGATADGRRAGEPYGTNFSPSLHAELSDPVSVVRSFTKQEVGRVINGGPLTLEFSGSIFCGEENRRKVATLLQYFIRRGGHQLQLNAVDAEAMRAAQATPERYRRLVVRVWGWSAYFVELDKDYQDHVMARQEYAVP